MFAKPVLLSIAFTIIFGSIVMADNCDLKSLSDVTYWKEKHPDLYKTAASEIAVIRVHIKSFEMHKNVNGIDGLERDVELTNEWIASFSKKHPAYAAIPEIDCIRRTVNYESYSEAALESFKSPGDFYYKRTLYETLMSNKVFTKKVQLEAIKQGYEKKKEEARKQEKVRQKKYTEGLLIGRLREIEKKVKSSCVSEVRTIEDIEYGERCISGYEDSAKRARNEYGGENINNEKIEEVLGRINAIKATLSERATAVSKELVEKRMGYLKSNPSDYEFDESKKLLQSIINSSVIKDKGFFKEKSDDLESVFEAAKKKKALKDNIIKALIVAFIALVLLGIYLGATDRAVFYMDKIDMFFSFLPLLTLLVSIVLGAFTWKIVSRIGIAVSLIIVFAVFIKSFRYNKRILASFSTALAKLTLSAAFVLCLIEVMYPSGKTASERRKTRSQGMISLAFLAPLMYILINGERVMEKESAVL